MEDYVIYYKSSYVRLSQASTNILSASNQFGLNVFEGIRVYYEQSFLIFRLEEHLERLKKSLILIGLPSEVITTDHFVEIITTLIKRNNFTDDFAIRMTYMVNEIDSWYSKAKPVLFIAPIKRDRISSPLPLRASIVDIIRISQDSMNPTIKCGANYINGRYALMEAKKEGADVAIMKNKKGFISESSGSCIFMIKNQILYTPMLEDDILDSITRDTIIKICSKINLKVIQKHITENDIKNADELFLCGSAAEITPIFLDPAAENTFNLTLKIFNEYRLAVTGLKYNMQNWVTTIHP